MTRTPGFPFRLIPPFLSTVTPGDRSSTSSTVDPVLVGEASTLMIVRPLFRSTGGVRPVTSTSCMTLTFGFVSTVSFDWQYTVTGIANSNASSFGSLVMVEPKDQPHFPEARAGAPFPAPLVIIPTRPIIVYGFSTTVVSSSHLRSRQIHTTFRCRQRPMYRSHL